MVFPWIAALILFLLIYAGRYSGKNLPLLDGILGNIAVVVVFFSIGRVTHRMLSPEFPFGRTTMAFGSWIMVFGAYTLILSSVQRLQSHKTAVILLSLTGFVAVIFLFASGFLNELSIVKEYTVRKDRFMGEFLNHILLSGNAVVASIVIGTPLGIIAFRNRVFEKPIFFIVNTVQTIPSLALFGIMIAPLALLTQRFPLLRELGIKGIGSTPALIALTLYALLPITRNTYTSLKVLDPSVIESALGMGMSKLQLLFLVEIPLSLPIIISGIRISMVQAIGNATVAALIGAGGFGVFVFQGLGQAAPDLILLGALPVIMLAVLVDKGMQLIIGAVTPRGLTRGEASPG